jgi:basic amino acid/polyamine antiporter, APA family
MSIWTRKSISALIADSASGNLTRALGPVALSLLGIGAIVGAGIFVLTGTVASQNTGPALVLSMILAGFACALAGLCYAELAAMIPVAGSAYTYAYATLGELVAWIIGWDLILEYSLSVSTVALGWGANIVSLAADVGVGIPARLTAGPGQIITLADGGTVTGLFNLPACLVVLLITALLVIGVKESAQANTAIVVVKLAVLATFVVAGAFYVKPALWHPFVPPSSGTFGQFGWSGVLRGAGVIFFAFIGFDAVSTAAQEARDPQRDMPIGIMVSLAVCTVFYIAVALVLTGLVPYAKLNVADPLNVGVAAMGLRWLGPIVKVGALAGMFSVMLVNLLAQPRIFYSMSRDGLLPPVFARIHPRFHTPYVTTIVTGVCVAAAAATLPLGVLGQLVSMGTLLAFGLVCVGVLVLRRTEPDRVRPFKTPLVPWVPGLGAAVCVYLMYGLPGTTWLRLVVWLAVGLAIYAGYGRRNAQRVRAGVPPAEAAAVA